MEKTEKFLRLKRRSGSTIQVVREHYVREDVPCFSPLCLSLYNCKETGQSRITLPHDATHYLVPDPRTALQFLEILETPEIQGIVFLKTVCDAVSHKGSRRLHKRLQSMVKDPRKKSVVFYNEFQKYAFTTRRKGEDKEEWGRRMVYKGAQWYYNHLAGQIPIVLVSEDQKFVDRYGNLTVGVFVVTLEQYLLNFWPDLTETFELYKSLSASLTSAAEATSTDSSYAAYLPDDVVSAGIKSGLYIQGALQVSKYNATNEAFVRRSGLKDDTADQDALIVGNVDRNRAIHGDIVAIALYPKEKWKCRSNAIRRPEQGDDTSSDDANGPALPTGRVVAVLQRNWRDYVVTFQQDQDNTNTSKSSRVLMVPYDYRVPKIRIATRQQEKLQQHRLIVRIDDWPLDSQYPNGHFVKSLGPIGQLETEVAVLLVENDIIVPPFTQAQLTELPAPTPAQPWCMSAEEVGRRRDLRESHLIFSIDPRGCEDVDDTLSVRSLPNGHYELGVHIADVTYFVQPLTLTDLEARSRSTTVYLADRRYDMLPEVLSADLCSLLSGVDRYAMSVIWELNESLEVVDVWYGRTVIRSKYKLFYEFAQLLAEGLPSDDARTQVPELQSLDGDQLEEEVEQLRWAVKQLMHISRTLKSRRTTVGALELEGSEVRVEMSENKDVNNLLPKQALEIHDTIAECMIFANHWVAKKIAQSFPNNSLLRRHPPPRVAYFQNLQDCAQAKGFSIETQSNLALAQSLDRAEDRDPLVNKILRMLATQAMSNAEYFSTGAVDREMFFHYGLALDYYTHFTSPIRRYADVLVHRLLLAALKQENEDSLMSNEELQDLSDHINKKHRAAQNAQRDSQELFQVLFFKSMTSDDERCLVDAVVFQLRSNGVLVFIPRYGIKTPLYLLNKEGQVIWVSDDTSATTWCAGRIEQSCNSLHVQCSNGRQSYQLFDHITVRIRVVESVAHASSLCVELVSRKPLERDVQVEVKEQRKALIQEVKDQSAEETLRSLSSDPTSLGDNYEVNRERYGQTPPAASLYQLLRSFKDMATKAQ